MKLESIKIVLTIISALRKYPPEVIFKNQVGRIIGFVDVSQTLFLATSVLPQWANDHSRHCGRDRGYTLIQCMGSSGQS